MSIVDTARTVGELVKKGMTVELQEKIMQLREEALGLQEENLRLKKENRELKERIELQQKVKRKKTVYWREGDEEPLCPYCYEKSHVLYHLAIVATSSNHLDRLVYQCPNCQIEYVTGANGDFHFRHGLIKK
jgi:regulator of replication initiation timing